MAFPLSNPNSSGPCSEREFEVLVASLFRQHGWRVKREPLIDDKRADLAVARGDQRYIVEIKSASEGRPDRLVPLLAQAILQARAFAQVSPEPAMPLAIVAAPAISPRAANNLIRFVAQFAPDAAAGILDREGFRHFVECPVRRETGCPVPRPAPAQTAPSPDCRFVRGNSL